MGRSPVAWLRAVALAVAVLVAACAAEDDDCPPASQQQQAAGAFVLSTTCIGCHSSQLGGADRQGAPPGMDFDRPEVVEALADDIYRTARDGSMPPPAADVPALSDAQVEAVRIYLMCEVNAAPVMGPADP